MPAPFPYTEAAARTADEAADAAPAAGRSAEVGWWLMVSQGLGLLWLIAWRGLLFGEGAAHVSVTHQTGELVVALVIMTYPLVLLGSAVFAWLAQRRRRNRRAVVLSLVPLVPILFQLAFVSYEDITDCCAMPTGSDTTAVDTTPAPDTALIVPAR